MIAISNQQRDDIVKYIDLLCETLTATDNKTYNIRRRARKLSKVLRAKQPFSAASLSERLSDEPKTGR